MKKVISLILSVMMIASLFTGCASSTPVETTAPATKETAAPTETAAPETEASAEAQEFNIAIVQQLDHASLDEIRTSAIAELQAKAAEKGVKVNVEEYHGQNDATVLGQIGAQVVGDKVDMIIPIATLAAQTMVTAAEGTDIPIVYAAISDPVSAGLTGLDKVTGTSDALNTPFILDMMLAVNPDIKTVGLLYSNSETNSATPIAEAKAYLDSKGIAYLEKTGNTTGEITEAASALVGRVDAVFTPTDNVVMAAEGTVAEILSEAGIPHYAGADSFVAAGAFATCGVNYTELGAYTADMAMDVLLGGAVPEFHVMDGGIITVNTETAAALSLDYSVFATMANTVVEVVTGE
ncbi:MAG: ABC transporter substrate-binding protein [Firmicutes bacterium]|nr:ABC transporter substrate-binding protein [Bacillota bacterium]